MHSRRHNDYVTLSPKMRNQHRYEVGGHEMYPASRRGDALDRSPRIPRRSLSPNRHKIDESRRVGLRDGKSGSIERRDYSWHSGAGRAESVRSGSPSYMTELRKPYPDEGIVQRKYEYADDIDYDNIENGRLKHVYGYDHYCVPSRKSKENDHSESRIVDSDEHVMMGHKSMPMEDVIFRGSQQVPPDFIPTSNYRRPSDHLQLPSRRMDMSHLEHEKIRYSGPISPEKIPEMEVYKEGEKPAFFSRDDSYIAKPASHTKGFGNAHFEDFAGTSSSFSRSDFLTSYKEGLPLCASDDYPRNSMKVTEPMDANIYGRMSGLDRRNNETGKRIMTSYPPETYSSNRTDHDDFLHPKSQLLPTDDGVYPSQGLHRLVPSRSRSDHDRVEVDYEYRQLSRASMHPSVEKVDPVEDSYGHTRYSNLQNQNRHRQAGAVNLDTSRISYAPKITREYVSSGYQLELGSRDSRDDEASHFGPVHDQKISQLRSDYGFGRDAGPQFQKERLQDPAMSMYDLEMYELSGKRPRMKDNLAIYEQSDIVVKRKYSVEENMNRLDSRTRGKQYEPQKYAMAYDSSEEWIDEGENLLHSSRTQGFDHTAAFRKAKRPYIGQDYHGDFVSEDRLYSQDSFAHSRKNLIRYYKPSLKYTKGQSGNLPWFKSNETDKRYGVQRKHKTWKRNDEDNDDELEMDDEHSQDLVNKGESGLSEDSDSFKQLVHEAFLGYSKRLNLSSAVQRRYKEQGRAGSLFCIVCGRSRSKEFMDTRRLVTHAFMSSKPGLRALHLGLHKAICIMMGWNTYVPRDTTTWVPDILPDAEAWAQKEDLMLWPPIVIIRNISMSNNNPEQQKVIPIEGVEAFLRGKGFVGGKIKVCLGKPADQSIMLVKFLGTFTALGIAERISNYFTENKRGREDFERKTSSGRKSSKGLEENTSDDQLEESLLYGYIGIVEDLDKLDFNTKKWIAVKSKKDIQDLENAPVKTGDR